MIHPFAPVYDENSEILILGTFPSVKSRENAFYYGHPQNRFWRVLANIYQVPHPQTIDEKKALLLSQRLALWDVLAQCEIKGSADASIRHAVANDLSVILQKSHISRILLNGKTALHLYEQHPHPALSYIALPSTSPANAAWSLDRLTEKWREGLLNNGGKNDAENL